MSRNGFVRFDLIRVIFIAVLTLSLPFVHVHPQLTHADPAGEHTHPAVVHTLFSPETGGSPAVPSNGIQSEDLDELFRAAIDLDLVSERFTKSLAPKGPDSVGAFSEPARTSIAKSNRLLKSPSVVLSSPPAGSSLSVRAPPRHSFS